MTPQMLQQRFTQIEQAVSRLNQGLVTLFTRLVRVSQRAAAAEARARLAAAGQKPRLPMEFKAQFGEDVFIWDALGQPLSGFFIEVGAFDGYAYSVTHGLEALGWNGLLVEALPGPCEACKARRPNSRVVHAALSRPGGPATATFNAASDSLGGMYSFLTTDEHHRGVLANSGTTTAPITVPQTTMDALLEGHAGSIDAAIIDVEGGEIPLLEGFDLNRWKPRVLILEDNARGRDPALERYMQSQPYHFLGWLEVNRLYIHNDERAVIEQCKRM